MLFSKIFFGCNYLFFNTLTLVRKKNFKKTSKKIWTSREYVCIFVETKQKI